MPGKGNGSGTRNKSQAATRGGANRSKRATNAIKNNPGKAAIATTTAAGAAHPDVQATATATTILESIPDAAIYTIIVFLLVFFAHLVVRTQS